MGARQPLAAVLMILLSSPAWSAPNIVGTVASSQSATVQGTALIPGTTVFSGDTIEVGPRGTARIALPGGAQVEVAENSRVRVSRASERTQFEVTRGGAIFRTSEQAPVEVRLAEVTVRAASGSSAIGLVAMLNPNSAAVQSEKGELVVTTDYDSKTVTLREGEVAEVKLEPADSPSAPQDKEAQKRRKVRVILIGVGAAIAATAIAIGLNHNEPSLSEEQKKAAVSPIIP